MAVMNRFCEKAILRDTYYLYACVVRDYMESVTKATRQSIIKAYTCRLLHAKTEKFVLSEPWGGVSFFSCSPGLQVLAACSGQLVQGELFFSAAVKKMRTHCVKHRH